MDAKRAKIIGRPTVETCGTCRAWERIAGDPGVGRCLRYAPRPEFTSKDDRGKEILVTWPAMPEGGRCAEGLFTTRPS